MKTGLIALSRLTPEDIEEMRQIRNHWVGRRILRNDRRVSPEEHRAWYRGLDQEKSHIFLVRAIADGRVIGYVACLGEGCDAGTADIGIFIKHDCPWLLAPYHAEILLIQHAFEDLGLTRLVAYFRPENVKAIRFNASLGFKEVRRTHREVMTELTFTRFCECRPGYRKYLRDYFPPPAENKWGVQFQAIGGLDPPDWQRPSR